MVMIPAKKEGAAAPTAPTTEKAKPAIPARAGTPAAGPVAAPAAEGNTAGPAAETATPAPAPTTTAVAPAPTTAVAKVAGRPVDVIANTFKNVLRVDWNTLRRLQANNGNFLDLEDGKKALGTEMTIELLSYQDNWQISPGTDDPNDVQYVRYSDDGITTNQGENVAEYVDAMKKAGYSDCKLGARCTLAFIVHGGTLDGIMCQMDLAPTSKTQFDRHRMQVALDHGNNRRDEVDARFMKVKAKPTTGAGNRTWTLATFEYAYPAGATPAHATA